MTYENTPHPDIDAGITLEQAAKIAGYTVAGFATTMSKLNKAGRDLRTPARPGERARRYDADKIKAWVKDGKPVPTPSKAPAPGARTVHGTATHKSGTWTATLETGDIATGKTVQALQTNAQALAAQKLELPVNQVSVQLDVTPPQEVAELWAQTVEEKTRGQEIIAAAIEKRHGIVANLKVGGFTNDDIAAMLGISPQRVQQHTKGIPT